MGETVEYRKLTREELNALAGEELPEKAAISLINANIAAPIKAALALDVADAGRVSESVATERSAFPPSPGGTST